MGFNDDELLAVAAEDRYISLNADLVLADVAESLGDSVAQDKLGDEIAKKLAELTNGLEIKQLIPTEKTVKPDFKKLGGQAAILY